MGVGFVVGFISAIISIYAMVFKNNKIFEKIIDDFKLKMPSIKKRIKLVDGVLFLDDHCPTLSQNDIDQFMNSLAEFKLVKRVFLKKGYLNGLILYYYMNQLHQLNMMYL